MQGRCKTASALLSQKVCLRLDRGEFMITIKDNMQLFKKYYKDEDINTLAGMVVKNKPDRLEELIYVANCDINIAMQIIEQRRYSLTTDLNIRNVP